MSDNLKEKMIGALTWSSIDRIGQQGVQFIIGIVLARLLCPADYGLIGMVMIFAQFAYAMVESGLGAALVRTKDLTETHCNTVFYTNLSISIILYTILFFCAPMIADFFNQPILTIISRVTFAAILFNSMYLVPFNIAGRELDYKTITKVNIISTIISGTAGITMAYYNMGVWALVVQQTGYHFVRMICFHAFSKWKPKLLFSFNILGEYFQFSSHMLGTSLLTVIFNNIYTFLLGKYYSINQVGFYTQGYKLSDSVNFTFIAILSTSYNLFAKIQHQQDRIKRILGELVKRTSLITIPATLFLIVAAKPLIITLLGIKWLEAVPYFQLICAANLFAPIYQINVHSLNSIGKSNITFRMELIKRMLILVSVIVCFSQGIIIMLLGYVVSCWIAFICSIWFVKHNIGSYYLHQIKQFLPNLILGTTIGGVVFALNFTTENYILCICMQIIVAIIIYVFYIKIWQNDLYVKATDLIKHTFLKK